MDTEAERRRRRMLFLCAKNSARSQMAEGFARHFGRGRVEAASAGDHPADELHPLAVKVMQEVGVDIAEQRAKNLERFRDERFDFVISVCQPKNEVCPTWVDASEITWAIEDPAAQSVANEIERLVVFRRVRDNIRRRVELFLLSHKLN
jgi:protein-tyrosine-phosphatase